MVILLMWPIIARVFRTSLGLKLIFITLAYLINVEDEINEEIKNARREGNRLLHVILPTESMKSEKTLSETLCLLNTSEYLR